MNKVVYVFLLFCGVACVIVVIRLPANALSEMKTRIDIASSVNNDIYVLRDNIIDDIDIEGTNNIQYITDTVENIFAGNIYSIANKPKSFIYDMLEFDSKDGLLYMYNSTDKEPIRQTNRYDLAKYDGIELLSINNFVYQYEVINERTILLTPQYGRAEIITLVKKN